MPKTKAPIDPELAIRVAELVAGGRGHSEVAEELSIDPRRVEPMVEYAMADYLKTRKRLAELERFERPVSESERRLIEKYPHLKYVHVDPISGVRTKLHYELLLKRWAAAAANYFDRLVRAADTRGDELHVTMSGGETILETMNSLPERDRPNVTYYASAALGRALHFKSAHVDPIANATIAWSRSGRIPGKCEYLTVPPIDLTPEMNTKERREQITREIRELYEVKPIRRHLELMFDQIDVAFTGLGVVRVPSDASAWKEKITATNLLQHLGIAPEEIATEGAVGEIGYNYFDSEGKGRAEWRFTLSAGDHTPKLRGPLFYKQLVHDKKDVIVAAGVGKAPALIPALSGKMFNVWFTDEPTAKMLLAPN